MRKAGEGGLLLRADGSEMLEYNRADLPIRTVRSTLSAFADYAAAYHWHRDFEALLVLEGEMDYFVNGSVVRLKPDEAVFVNSRRLHYGFSAEKKDCIYQFIVYDPELFDSYAPLMRAVDDVSGDHRSDFVHLRGRSEEEERAIRLIRESLPLGEEGRALALLSVCAGLTECAGALLAAGEKSAARDGSWELLRSMTGYIQQHYRERILLKDLSSAAAVCRSRCCSLFREKLGCTPGEYITHYRLNKACGMIDRGYSVTDAAMACGFNGTSYFSETFRRVYGISPREYRSRGERQ